MCWYRAEHQAGREWSLQTGEVRDKEHNQLLRFVLLEFYSCVCYLSDKTLISSKACPKLKQPITTICPSRAEEEILSWKCNARSPCSPKFMQFISFSVYFVLRLVVMHTYTHILSSFYCYFWGSFYFQGKIDIGQPSSLLVSWWNDLNMCNILSATSWHCVYGTSWMSWWLQHTVVIMTLQTGNHQWFKVPRNKTLRSNFSCIRALFIISVWKLICTKW